MKNKKLTKNVYFYNMKYKKQISDFFQSEIDYDNIVIFSEGKKYNHKTKLKLNDFPKHYCDIHKHWYTYSIFNAKGIVDIKYTWCKENHFMKDSALHISYTGKLNKYYEIFRGPDGKEYKSFMPSYENDDFIVFGNSIFKALAYIKEYSPNVDLSKVRDAFINQCKWLEKNEPKFAPELENKQTYGKWFDKVTNIKEFQNKDE